MPRSRYSTTDSSSEDDADNARGPSQQRRGEQKSRSRSSSSSEQYADASSTASDSDSDSQKRLRPRRSRVRREARTSYSLAETERGPSAYPNVQQSRTGLICFLGVALTLCLVVVGGFAFLVSRKNTTSNTATESVSPTADQGGGKTETPRASSTTSAASTVSADSSVASSTSTSNSNSTSKSTASSTGSAITLSGLARNNIGIGFLPDYTNQNLQKITEGLGIKSSFYGWYSQLPESDEWDGAQLLAQLDDIKACNCIFQPAVMPTKGWKGLTKSDNFQALAIAKVMKKFTDEGIEVQLRFAHEVNWYQSDGTYKGTASDFKEGWAAVAAAVADNPKVKMFFTPNVAGALEDYVAFMPDDLSTVHLLGIDYYPSKKTDSFVDHMKPLYSKYCADGKILFAIGETGNGWEGPIEERLGWLEQCTSKETAEAMPYFVGVTWFNYKKEREFRLWIEKDDGVNDATKKWIADTDGISASGATAGNA
ncbi:uncharacterized protein JCM15063_001819 [Sporobolomyces koalae]|uniref:uncharacterized protein n=1 Tax=Sporobolomyces koalae TaxID=500713 RepID=UPI003176BD7C